MRYSIVTMLVLGLLVILTLGVNAQDRFDRSGMIYADSLDIGGFGNIVAGVDFDGDGRMEIYAVNDDWYDQLGLDLVPRIYKYEKNDMGEWEVVWSTRLPLEFQNTWPALAAADLDQDGKMEIVWGPVNNLGGGLQPNPVRVVVFETPGDGSDNMGVQNPDGTWRPNAQWTIVNEDNVEQRPFRWMIYDIDGDGTDEIVAGCRRGDGIQVYSVDNIPDAADSSETWTLEFSGLNGVTFYDMTILNDMIVGIESNGDVWLVKYDATGDSFVVSGPQVGLAGRGSWKSAQTVDIDSDGTDEIILASWSSYDNDVYLLQQSGDTLISTKIVDVPSSSYRSYGGAVGDIDADGMLDFVFGTRSSTPNAIIHRAEFQGGDITDPANWVLTAIDSLVWPAIQYDITAIANLDDDPEDEVIYSGIPRGLTSDYPPQPLVILDLIPQNQPVITNIEDVPNDQGRQVWVIWRGSQDDMQPSLSVTTPEGTIPVTIVGDQKAEFPNIEVGDKRLVPVYVNNDGLAKAAAVGDITGYTVWRVDDGVPVQVASVEAIQSDMYAAVVPTLGDGPDWEATFFVTAHTVDPVTNWKSFPKMGMSEDNLIPTAPTVEAQMTDTQIQLVWEELPDPDINYYSIRRGTNPEFDPNDPATEIGTTVETMFVDDNVQPGQTYYYRVVAFDFNGNQGEFSEVVSATVVGIAEESLNIPKEFSLHQNYPNPFNPETQITFDLPKRAEVSIVIYNSLGQKVRTLVSGTKEAGTHTVVWDGRNDQGARVASGVYIYMMRAGDFQQARKMSLMR